mmetsp:Transcript_6977/g.13002  ORF Transcript_6977/g.13002 Transcript_6977/m.13002 type:complete len:312 (+) Transcript_6977:375-1310(+)
MLNILSLNMSDEPKEPKPDTKEEEDRKDDREDRDGEDDRDRYDDKEKDDRDKDDDQDKDDDRDKDKKRRDDSRSPSRSRSRGRDSRSRSRSRGRKKTRDRSRDRSRSGDSDRAKKYGDDCYGRKLYVGNLDFRTDQEYLKDKFRKFGPIDDVFIPRDGRGDSRGFAFITFEDRRDAEDAVDRMHDSRLDGRRITCNIARPRPPLRGGGGGGGRDRSRSPGGGGGGGRGPGPVSPKIYIGNLPMDVRESEIEDMYKKFGPIVRIDLKTPNRPPAYAFVEYEDERDAEDALRETNGKKFGRDYLRVEFSRIRR